MDNNQLLDLSGVIGVARNNKEVLITTRKPVELPAEIDGLPVRKELVVGEPKFENIYNRLHRPLRPGVRIHQGSAGFYIEHRGDVYLITCAHIAGNRPELWRDNQRPEGVSWHQPRPNVVLPYHIGYFHDWVHPMHGIDGMALKLESWIGVDNKLLEEGFVPQKIIDAEVGMKVLRMGKTTGLKTGEITHDNASVSVRTASDTWYRVHNTFRTNAIADAGDSGGPFVCAETGNIIGILVAGFYGHTPQWGQKATDVCRMLGFGEYPKLARRKGGTKIELWVNNPIAQVNGQDVPIDIENREVVPFIVPEWGRTMGPYRFIAEALGTKVEWDEFQGKITIIDEEE